MHCNGAGFLVKNINMFGFGPSSLGVPPKTILNSFYGGTPTQL